MSPYGPTWVSPILALALAAFAPVQSLGAAGSPPPSQGAQQAPLAAVAEPQPHAGWRGPQPGEAIGTLTVRGEARLSARPDLATIRLGVWARSPTARQAQESVARAAGQVIEALTALGIAPDGLQTQGLSLQPVWRHNERTREPELAGYEALYTLRVDVADLARVGEVVDAAIGAGANRIESIVFTVRDTGPLKEQALQQAVADGIRQARVLAAAAGMRLGALRRIGDVQFGGPPVVRPVAPLRAGAEVMLATPVEPGLLEFTASVSLDWELVSGEGPPP